MPVISKDDKEFGWSSAQNAILKTVLQSKYLMRLSLLEFGLDDKTASSIIKTSEEAANKAMRDFCSQVDNIKEPTHPFDIPIIEELEGVHNMLILFLRRYIGDERMRDTPHG